MAKGGHYIRSALYNIDLTVACATLKFVATIFKIPTTLKFLPLFLVSEGQAVEIMPENCPMEVIVIGGSHSNRENCPHE